MEEAEEDQLEDEEIEEHAKEDQPEEEVHLAVASSEVGVGNRENVSRGGGDLLKSFDSHVAAAI